MAKQGFQKSGGGVVARANRNKLNDREPRAGKITEERAAQKKP